MKYERLTAKDRYWENEELWTVAQELTFEEIDEIYNRLAELEDKIEAGTLIELPCKVGDVVYEAINDKYSSTLPFIQETIIEKIVITKNGLRLKLARNSFYETAISSLGKTIFLTKDEAEKRLKELRGVKIEHSDGLVDLLNSEIDELRGEK